MRLTRSLLLTIGLIGLSACSTLEPPPNALSQTFVGAWTVVHAWPAGSVPLAGVPAPEGQTIAITPTTATDPLGRSCGQPTYTVAPGMLATALGIDAPSSEQGLVLDVTCGGRPFARYVANGTRMMSVADGWLFELRPTATTAAVRQTTPAPAPVPVVTATPAPAPSSKRTTTRAAAPAKHTTAQRHTTGETLYLASYRTQDSAMAGWKVLLTRAAPLKGLQPTFKEVDLGAKGRYVRLYATGASADTQSRICSALGKSSPDCGARY